MLNCIVLAAALGASMLSAPLHAQKVQAPKTSPGDPNERICENITPTGSRLATRRFCGTRAQWADKQLQDRQEIEKIQRSPCVYQGNSASGRPSC